MKRLFAISAATLGSLFSLSAPAHAFFGPNPIVGSWTCKGTIKDNEMIMTSETEVIYSRNNTFTESGTIVYQRKDLNFPFVYHAYTTGTWKSMPGNIVKLQSSNVNVTNQTAVPGKTYQQDAAIRAEIDKMVPLAQMFKDTLAQGLYSKYKFSNNNNRSRSVPEGARDWSDATVCDRV